MATGSLWAASLLADVVAHLAGHGTLPRGAEAGRTFRASGQINMAAVIPLVLPMLAGVGVLATERALRGRVGVGGDPSGCSPYSPRVAPIWRGGSAALVAALVGLGALVVLLKTLAH